MKKCILIFILIYLISCAKKRPYSPILIEDLTFIKKQQDKVKTIIWTGKLSVKTPENDLNADILVIGKKAPFNIRIEVTSWLSGPIFYVLIKGKRVSILSIKEKKLYLTSLNSKYPVQFFPSQLNQEQIWAILRGLPMLKEKDTLILVSQKIEIRFKDYRMYQGLIFAKDINVYCYPTNTLWRLNIRNIKFNNNIPDDIFKLNVPADFQIIRYQVPNF